MTVAPGVIATAFEIERIAGSEIEELIGIKDQLQPPGEYVHELLPFVSVGAFARRTGCEHETVAIHHRAALGQKLHRDTWRRFRPCAPSAGADDLGHVVALFPRKPGNRGSIICRKVVQRLETHPLGGAFERRQCRGSNANVTGNLIQCLAGAVAQTAQPPT